MSHVISLPGQSRWEVSLPTDSSESGRRKKNCCLRRFGFEKWSKYFIEEGEGAKAEFIEAERKGKMSQGRRQHVTFTKVTRPSLHVWDQSADGLA